MVMSLLGNLLLPFDRESLASCDEYHREFAIIQKNDYIYSLCAQFEESLESISNLLTLFRCFSSLG